jgi:porin
MTVAAALLVGGGAAADEPPLPWVGDIWTRERLTGDWGGARTSLAENYGIEFEVDTTQYFQGVASGGFDDNGGLEYSGHADYRLHLNTGKAGLWPGGFLLVHGESYWGDTVNASTGATLPANMQFAMPAAAGNGTYLTELSYTQFLSENFLITGGKFAIDPMDHRLVIC